MNKIDNFILNLRDVDSNQAKTIINRIDKLTIKQKENLNHCLAFIEFNFEKHGKSSKDIAIAWKNIVKVLIKEKYYFIKYKEYRCKSLDEAIEKVYSNSKLMFDYDTWILLSNVINTNHIKLFEFFTRNFNLYKGNKYLEIGPGHGLFFYEAIKTKNYNEYLGVDISKTSLQMTDQILGYNSISKSYKLEELNLFDIPELIKYDFITCGEVLEHVENPELMLNKIHSLLSDEGKAYISTAINSPAPDHIYLFKTFEEVENLLISCNFEILDKIETSLEESNPQMYTNLTDVSVGYIIRKYTNAV